MADQIEAAGRTLATAKATAQAAPAPVHVQQTRSRLIFLMGKGGVGKTTLACVAIEAAREAGRKFRIWDMDPANLRGSALARRFDGVEVPPALGYDDRRNWLEDQVLAMAEMTAGGKPQTVLVDVGADDPLLLQLGREVEFIDTLDAAGIEVVGVHVIGDAEGDLRYLRETEEAGLFKPRRIAVVLNCGRVPSDQKPRTVFEPQVRRVVDLFKADPQRGEEPVFAWFPKLSCMTKVQDNGLRTFRETAQHTDPKWMLDRMRVAYWLDKEVPREILEPLAGFLP